MKKNDDGSIEHLGFRITGAMRPVIGGLTQDDLDRVQTGLIAYAERYDLWVTGVNDLHGLDFYCTAGEGADDDWRPRDATEADRQVMQAWLDAVTQVQAGLVGPLSYGWAGGPLLGYPIEGYDAAACILRLDTAPDDGSSDRLDLLTDRLQEHLEPQHLGASGASGDTRAELVLQAWDDAAGRVRDVTEDEVLSVWSWLLQHTGEGRELCRVLVGGIGRMPTLPGRAGRGAEGGDR